MSNMPRMRTVKEAINEIKQMDANTSITESAIRSMIKNGDLPYVQISSKRLICLDLLIEILSTGNVGNKKD